MIEISEIHRTIEHRAMKYTINTQIFVYLNFFSKFKKLKLYHLSEFSWYKSQFANKILKKPR